MRRWALEDLADYVRGVAAAETRTAIEADLASGAPGVRLEGDAALHAEELRRDIRLLAEVSAALRGDQRAERASQTRLLPESRLRQPAAGGELAQPAVPAGPSRDALVAVEALPAAVARTAEAPLPVLPLLSVRDPFAGLPAGFRGARLGHRELQIKGERFELELSVDTPYDAADVIVVGRLAPGRSEQWTIEEVPAVLVGSGQVLATAVTNHFGEFHVATETEENRLELCLLISGVGQIRVPIDRRDPLCGDRT